MPYFGPEDVEKLEDRLAREAVERGRKVGKSPLFGAPYDDNGGIKFKEPDTRTAAGIAARAADLVGGNREKQHGAKSDNFTRIATMWDAYMRIRREPAAPIDALDVGHFMVLMKLARTQSGSLNVDDYIDAAGYAACAGEVAQDFVDIGK